MTPYTKEYIAALEKESKSLRVERRIFMLVTCACAFATFALVWGFRSQAHKITLNNEAIQSQRYNSILTGCLDQNERHNNTISTLDNLIKKLPKSQRVRAKSNERFTILLINALAPKRNCKLLAFQSTTIAATDKEVPTHG